MPPHLRLKWECPKCKYKNKRVSEVGRFLSKNCKIAKCANCNCVIVLANMLDCLACSGCVFIDPSPNSTHIVYDQGDQRYTTLKYLKEDS